MRLNKHFIAYVLTFAMVLSLGNINEVLAADTLLASANATASSNASSNASANASESASQTLILPPADFHKERQLP